MPDVYSPALALALALGSAALVGLVAGRARRNQRWLALARVGALLTIVTATAALASHLALGHTPGTERSLGWAGFIEEHPMALVILAGALVVLAASRTRDP